MTMTTKKARIDFVMAIIEMCSVYAYNVALVLAEQYPLQYLVWNYSILSCMVRI